MKSDFAFITNIRANWAKGYKTQVVYYVFWSIWFFVSNLKYLPKAKMSIVEHWKDCSNLAVIKTRDRFEESK